MKLTIDRSIWLRGNEEEYLDNSYLRNRKGQQCCVGIYLTACGVKGLTGKKAACSVSAKLPEQAKWLIDGAENSDLAMDLYVANDGQGKASHREKKVKSLFKKAGVEVEFVGEGA